MYRSDLIRSKVVNRDLNMSSFSKEAGISLNTVRRLWNGEINVELASLKKASDFLGISIPDLFSDPNDQSISS